MTGLQHLKQLHFESVRAKHPNLPIEAIAPGKFDVTTANGLTKAVVAYIGFIGGWATRVTTTGRMLPTKVTEVSTQLKFIPGTTKRGTADVMGSYKGIPLAIEIKIGKDRQSDAQKRVEMEFNASGGRYYLCKDFESFYQWINSL